VDKPTPKRQVKITYVDRDAYNIWLMAVPDVIVTLEESGVFTRASYYDGSGYLFIVNELYDLDEVVAWIESMNPEDKEEAMAETTVVNVKADQYDTYIGQPSRNFKRSEWCNLFKIGRGGTREEVITLYEGLLREKLRHEAGALERLLELKGLRLGCWCAPKACHGDIMAAVIDMTDKERALWLAGEFNIAAGSG